LFSTNFQNYSHYIYQITFIRKEKG
jgi:hypothetical protein